MKNKKLLYLVTGALLLLIVLTFTVFNPPQCPENYTQAQVDAANCIVGANIGQGLILPFIIFPLSFVVLVLWLITLTKRRKK